MVIIKNLNDDTKQAALISQVKSYINGEAESLPQDCMVNKNVSDVFDISSVKTLPDVDIFYDYIGANMDELSKKIYISNGMVIIPSTAGADISSETYEIISQKNIAPVVITCSKDVLDTKIKDNSADNIYYTDLEPYKARLMLMFLLNKKSDSDSIKNANNLSEIVIDGGNHAQFGNYGEQLGDNSAKISSEKQWNETIKEILNFMK